MKLHPALKRLLTECVPPVGQVRARIANEMIMREKDATAIKKLVQKELAHHLARMIVEDGRGTHTEEERFEDNAVDHRLTLHALSPMELNALVIAAFEAGRKVGQQDVFAQAMDDMLKVKLMYAPKRDQKFEESFSFDRYRTPKAE